MKRTPQFSNPAALKAENSRNSHIIAGTAFRDGCSRPRDHHTQQFTKYRIPEQAVFLMAYRDIIP